MFIPLKDLETKGYLIIKQFLSSEEIQRSIDLYETAKINNQDNTIKILSYKNATVFKGSTPEFIQNKIIDLLEKITRLTNLNVNFVFPKQSYFDNTYVQLDWHCDHDSYFKFQDSYNFLNFWMPIVKPDKNKSGLDIIPYDLIMPFLSPIAKERLIGKGAKSFIFKDNKTIIKDDSTGDVITLDINLELFKITPALSPGDLLIIRGDVIHKTQDNSTARIGISTRACNGDYMLSKEVFYDQCPKKQAMIKNDPAGYESHHKNFAENDFVKIRKIYE
jgi:ectoine hydroxylase-related dioxygenase (phytanoyl-CoA dioxygenase family)